MKEYIKIILSVLSKARSFLLFAAGSGKNNKVTIPVLFYNSFFSCRGTGNRLSVSGRTEKSDFFIEGSGNTVNISNAEITGTIITVTGNNNSIECEDGVVLRKSVITIRGNSCRIKIGKASSFGGARIINTGQDNDIRNMGERYAPYL